MQIINSASSPRSLSSTNLPADAVQPGLAGPPGLPVGAAVRHAAAAAAGCGGGAVASTAACRPQALASGDDTAAGIAVPLGPSGSSVPVNSRDVGQDRDAANAYPASGRNFSSDTIIRPSQLVDQGFGRGLYITIYVGRPVGVITDVMFFFDLLKLHREMAFKIFETFKEAAAYYDTLYSLGYVRFGERLAIPLPMFFPGGEANPIPVSSAAPTPVTIEKVPRNRHLFPHTVVGPRSGPSGHPADGTVHGDPAPDSPSPLSKATVAPAQLKLKAKEVVEVPSSEDGDSEASSSEEMDDAQVEFIDDEDHPRLAHISKYPRPAGSARAASPSVVVTSHTIRRAAATSAPAPPPAASPAVVVPVAPAGRAASQAPTHFVPAVFPAGATPVASTGRAASQVPTHFAHAAFPAFATPVASMGRAASQVPTHFGNAVIAHFDAEGDLQFNPVLSEEPLGLGADPSRNFSHPDINPNPAVSKSSYVLSRATPALAPPSSSRKRSAQSTEAADGPPQMIGNTDEEIASAKKRRREAIQAAFAKGPLFPTASAATETPSIFAGTPVGPAAASSSSMANATRARSQAQGQHFVDLDSSGSDTEWQVAAWTQDELDAAGPALSHPPSAIASVSTHVKDKKGKAKAKPKTNKRREA